MVLPKGTSFEFLTQWDVNLIVIHINSTPREILSGRTPYEVVLETLGEDILKAFQLKPIEPDKVNLTPKLIWSYVKKKYKLNTTNFLSLCNC